MLAVNDEFDQSKEALKRKIEDDHPEWRERRPMPMPIRDVLKGMIEDKIPVEDYAHDAWWIMRVQPNCYRAAEDSLKREGFETYSPTYKVIEPMPMRFIPPKKRHQSNLYKREARKRRFDGYAFVRRMFGCFDVNRLFDLNGCGALIKTAGHPALVSDLEVEVMRLCEADGTMDEIVVERYRGYRVSKLASGTQWTGQSKIIGRLDAADKTVLFVETQGRIARLIAEADPAESPI